MNASKFILLLAVPGSPLAELGPRLKELDFRVSLAPSADAAIAFMKRESQLSLIVVDAGTDGVEPALLAKLKDDNADLPVIWILGEDDEEPDFGLREPNATLRHPLEANALTDQAKRLLHDDFYPASLMQALVSASNSVMTTTFQLSTDIDAPWLKLSGMIPGDVNAFMPFMAEGVIGHLMVSGTLEHLVHLGLQLGFEEEEGSRSIAREVLGEVSNQIVGRLKNDCRSFMGDIRLGLPLVFSGKDMDVNYPSSKPSLCVEVDDGVGRLHIEFSFQLAHVERATSELQQAGEVLLF